MAAAVAIRAGEPLPALPEITVMPFNRLPGPQATVEDRLAQFGPAVQRRLKHKFAAAGVAWPPRQLTFLAFKDIHPQAPFHALVIPKVHVATLNDFTPEQRELVGGLLLTAKRLAAEHALPGYRVAMSVNREGGQVVFHAHLHVLGGRQLKGALG